MMSRHVVGPVSAKKQLYTTQPVVCCHEHISTSNSVSYIYFNLTIQKSATNLGNLEIPNLMRKVAKTRVTSSIQMSVVILKETKLASGLNVVFFI